MSTLLNPPHSVAYDPSIDRIVLTLRPLDGSPAVVVELDPDEAPPLINSLMLARSQAKRAAKTTTGVR
jgi:hypothetical protein